MTTTIFKYRCLKQISLKQRRRRARTSRRRTKSSFVWCTHTFTPTSCSLTRLSSSGKRQQGAGIVALMNTMPVRHTAFPLPKTCQNHWYRPPPDRRKAKMPFGEVEKRGVGGRRKINTDFVAESRCLRVIFACLDTLKSQHQKSAKRCSNNDF